MDPAQAPSLAGAASFRQSCKRQARVLLTPSPSSRTDRELLDLEDAELR